MMDIREFLVDYLDGKRGLYDVDVIVGTDKVTIPKDVSKGEAIMLLVDKYIEERVYQYLHKGGN